MKLAPLILHYLTAASTAIPDMCRIQDRIGSSSFFFASQEILRQHYQRRSWMFSYSKQITFYALNLSFTFTAGEYADVVNVYGFLLWMLNTRAGFHIDKLGFDD
jgi:hypothetical protein